MITIHPAVLDAIHTEEPDVSVSPDSHPPCIKTSSGSQYYFKLGSPREADQYTGESEALKHIHIAAPGLAPRVLACGLTTGVSPGHHLDVGSPYFVSQFKNIGSLTESSARILGKRLATELHEYKSTQGFGFAVPTYCGKTRQDNGWYTTWAECFDALINGLITKLDKRGQFQNLCGMAHLVFVDDSVIPPLLKPLVIQPVLLHGDLWSGNAGTDRLTGEPVIFDPSSYFGHNEADLAIARIFGGFPQSFFSTYHEHLPKTEPQGQYELRGNLYELYHYLNHTVLFAYCVSQGAYAESSISKMNRLLEAFPE